MLADNSLRTAPATASTTVTKPRPWHEMRTTAPKAAPPVAEGLRSRLRCVRSMVWAATAMPQQCARSASRLGYADYHLEPPARRTNDCPIVGGRVGSDRLSGPAKESLAVALTGLGLRLRRRSRRNLGRVSITVLLNAARGMTKLWTTMILLIPFRHRNSAFSENLCLNTKNVGYVYLPIGTLLHNSNVSHCCQ